MIEHSDIKSVVFNVPQVLDLVAIRRTILKELGKISFQL